MIFPETISEYFVEWLESMGVGTFNDDLYINQVPQKAPDACYWVITSGGSPIYKLRTGEKIKQYFVTVYYRSTKSKDVEKNMFRLEEMLDKSGCLQLGDLQILEVESNQFPSDVDLDSEDRRIGTIQASITLYKKNDTQV